MYCLGVVYLCYGGHTEWRMLKRSNPYYMGNLYAVVSRIELLIKKPMLRKKQKEYDGIVLKKQKIESCIADLGKQKYTYETCVNKIRGLEDYIQELRG